jgi:RNA polymerase sigma factor (sigma-70 family)
LLRRCQDENTIDDVIQETLMRAARYRGGLSSSDRLGSWVTRIAGNVFRDHTRIARRGPSVGHEEEVFDLLESRDPRPGEVATDGGYHIGARYVERRVLAEHLAAAFAELIVRDRVVLSEYYGGCGDALATATRCGISPGLVKVRLFRARRRLERALHLRICDHYSRLLFASL